MRPFTLFRGLFALVVVAVLVALSPVAGGASVPTKSLSGTATYQCQYSGLLSEVRTPGGLPIPSLGFDLPSLGGSDAVAVTSVVKAPSTVVPGEALKLSGVSRFTFGTNATATNVSTVFAFLSDDFGVKVTVGSYQRLLRFSKLTTTKSTLTSRVVTARWTLPDFLVPSSATGTVRLSLPNEAIVTNPVSTSPRAVAFTGALSTDSFLQPKRLVACALKADQDTVIGAVKVAAATAEAVAPDPVAAPTPVTAPVAPSAPRGTGVSTPVGVTPPVGAIAPSGAAPTVPTATAPLAAEPIPPATVADGLRLPPWALLLIGAFAAGGVFLALSSHLGLRHVAVASVALALLVVVPNPLNPQPSAEAARARTQVTLICVYNDTDAAADARARDQPTGLSISLDVPASVSPGEVITLSGSASVQAPEDIRSQAAQLGFTQLDAISDTLSVGLTVGSAKRQVFTADRWQTGKTNFGNPLVVSAPLYFPSFKVPTSASGAIKLELPRNEVLKRRPPPHSNPHTPPRTALEFVATVSGNGARATYLVDCWRSDKGSGLIATIPVVKAGASGPRDGVTPPAQAPGSVAGAPSTSDPGPAAVATDGPKPSAAATPGAAATGTPVPGKAGVVTAAGSAPLLQGAPVGATPRAENDAAVPLWLLIVLGVVGVAGYAYGVRNHLRLRKARQTG